MFSDQKLARRSVVDLCAEALQRSILSGDAPVGSRLPPERDLADQMGVSRLTLRSALSRVTANGLLSVRQGSGYVVQDVRHSGGPDLLPDIVALARDGSERRQVIGDLLAMRRQVARVILERLAEPAERKDISGILDAIERFADHVEAGATTETIARADHDVITAMIDATGSTVYALCINPILSVVMDVTPLRDAMYRTPADTLAAYRIMQYWLLDPDPKFIGRLMTELVRRDEATVRYLARPDTNST